LVDPVPCERRINLAIAFGWGFWRSFWHSEGGADLADLCGPMDISQKAKMADPAETAREHMHQEAANELVRLERHNFLLVARAIIFPAETHGAVFAADKAAIADRDAVGVPAEIIENLACSAKRRFGIDHPSRLSHRLKISCQGARLSEMSERAGKFQNSIFEGGLKMFQEEAAEKPGQHVNRQEKARAACDPAPIRSEAATGHDTMDMRVVGEGLSPCMQNRDHARLGAQMFRISANHTDRFGRRLEKDIIDHGLVLKRDGGDRRGYREDNVEIGNREKLGLTIGKPLRACEVLALWAVPVPAAIVGDACVSAIITPLYMTAKSRCPACFDSGHDTVLI
jgi:hypothetical protein